MFFAKNLNTERPVQKQLHGNNLNPRTFQDLQIPREEEQKATKAQEWLHMEVRHHTAMVQQCSAAECSKRWAPFEWAAWKPSMDTPGLK